MKPKHSWVITKDYLANAESGPGGTNSNAVGVNGPRGHTVPLEMIKANGTRFQMFDDDDVLYYEGYGLLCESGYEPLYEFGLPNAGCTQIKWESELPPLDVKDKK